MMNFLDKALCLAPYVGAGAFGAVIGYVGTRYVIEPLILRGVALITKLFRRRNQR